MEQSKGDDNWVVFSLWPKVLKNIKVFLNQHRNGSAPYIYTSMLYPKFSIST